MIADRLREYKELYKNNIEKFRQDVEGNYFNIIQSCIKNGGHIPKENYFYITSGFGGTKVHEICERCRMSYERNLTNEEWKNFDKLINTPLLNVRL